MSPWWASRSRILERVPEPDQQPFRPGDRADFDRLYRHAYPKVRYTLQAMLRDPAAAEDCAQETFTKAFRAWDGWKGEAPAEAWLYRIAINVAASYRRRERVHGALDSMRHLGRPHELADGTRLDLIDALHRLPARDAAAIVLRHHHGYTSREIAAALGIPESTVASRLASARRRLQLLLGERAPGPADSQMASPEAELR